MEMDALVLEAVARLKRSQPRNAVTIFVCNALEAVLYRVTDCLSGLAARRKAKQAAMRRWRGKRITSI
jgi:hypothetical protein